MDEEEYAYIKIPYPESDAGELHFKITAPISSLVITPEIGTAWATGRYHDPMFVAALGIQQLGSVAEIIAADAPASSSPVDFSYADKSYWNAPAREHHEPLLSINNGAANSSLSVRVI